MNLEYQMELHDGRVTSHRRTSLIDGGKDESISHIEDAQRELFNAEVWAADDDFVCAGMEEEQRPN